MYEPWSALPCSTSIPLLPLTGQPEDLLDRVLAPSFRLWDAYGVLPVLCDPTLGNHPGACCVRYDQVKDIIRSTKER